MSKCKRCGIRTVLNEDEINDAVNRVINMKGIRLVDDDTYNKRIKICMECDKFEYGSTCALCGCIMQVRARLREGKCPYPKKNRWGQ